MKIVTFNAGLLSIKLFGKLTVLEPASFVAERMKALPAHLASTNADVIVIQEIYRTEHKRWLACELRGLYTYTAFSQSDPRLRLVPDSLMILSKYPLTNSRFVRFRAGLWDERLLDSKGFLSAEIPDSPLGPMRICNVHTTAGALTHPEHPRIDAIRMLQLEELVTYAKRDARNMAVILAGDFNCGPSYTAADEPMTADLIIKAATVRATDRVSMNNYRRITELGFSDTFSQLKLPECPTWSPTANPLNAGGTHSDWGCPAQRIDHVFVESRKMQATDGAVFLQEEVVEIENHASVPLSDHYGYWVTLERVER